MGVPETAHRLLDLKEQAAVKNQRRPNLKNKTKKSLKKAMKNLLR